MRYCRLKNSERLLTVTLVPLSRTLDIIAAVNQRITELQLRHAARALLRSSPDASGREFRRLIREQRGVAGNTARIFAIWREEQARAMERAQQEALASVPERAAFEALEARTLEAETRAKATLERAELAELREQAHQARWALEIDKLREQLRTQINYAAEARRLQSLVGELTVEVSTLRQQLASN